MKCAALERLASRQTGRTGGGVLLVVMILALIVAAAIGSFLALAANDARLAAMALDTQKASLAAEAGLEYGVQKLKDVVLQYRLSPYVTSNELQTLINVIPPPPPIAPYLYQSPSGKPAFCIRVESAVTNGVVTNGWTCFGSDAASQSFSITCGAMNPGTRAGVVLKQTVQAVQVKLSRFGIFCDGDLEVLPDSPMSVAAPIHCNGDMYVGGQVSFVDRVTVHGKVFHRRKDCDGRPGNARVLNAATNLLSMILDSADCLDSDHANWMGGSLQRWNGRLTSGAHGVTELMPSTPPSGNAHTIVERPVATDNPAYSSQTEAEKFANKAALRLHVSAGGVLTAVDCRSNDVTVVLGRAVLAISGTNAVSGLREHAKEADGAYRFLTNGVCDTSQTNFYDAREACSMAPVDLYIDQLQKRYPELWTRYGTNEGKGVVYVTRDDPDGSAGGVVPCVRIRNASCITNAYGLSVVTDLPVYIEGWFNTDAAKPVLVAGDTVTLLSPDWQDARSRLALASRIPRSTAYNAAIMTGNGKTQWGKYNGGIENVLRLLEDWQSPPQKTVAFSGPIAVMWTPQVATSAWCQSVWCTDPVRNWGYDVTYRTNSPPHMTQVYGMEEVLWTRTGWREEGL